MGLVVVLGAATWLSCSESMAQLPSGSAVVPRAYERTDAPGTSFWALSPFDGRRQLLIGSGHLTPLMLRNVQKLTVRRNTGDNGPLDGGRLAIDVWMSHTVTSPDAPSNRFADNRGFDHRPVFQGVVVLPNTPPSPVSPASWSVPYAVEITLQTPFFYRGGTLCIETVTRPAIDPQTGIESSPWWPVDSVVQNIGGSVSVFGTSCIPGMPGMPAGGEPRTFVIGADGVFFLRGFHIPGNGYCLLGLDNTSLRGGIPLPLDLSPYSAPGCHLYLDPLTMVAASLTGLPRAGASYARIQQSIPADPLLIGAPLFSQWMLEDLGVNGLGLTFSNAVRATIGGMSSPLGIGWVESVDLTASTGSVLAGRSPVLKIGF